MQYNIYFYNNLIINALEYNIVYTIIICKIYNIIILLYEVIINGINKKES